MIRFIARIFMGNLSVHLENEIYETDRDGKSKEMFISNKFVLVREIAPNNFRYIESWHVYSMMSQNMVIAGFVTLPLIFHKIICHDPSNPGFWKITAGVVLMLIILFMYNAFKFSTWSINDHNAALTKLHLVERAQKLAEEQKDTPKSAK